MHDALATACDLLGIALPHVQQAAATTAGRLGDIRDELTQQLGTDLDDALDVVVFGSIARDEMSADSDFDHLVVSHGSVHPTITRAYRVAVRRAAKSLAIDEPGSSGLFGTVVSSQELIDRIGLETDTNLTHSRRVLTLEESRSLLLPKKHDHLKEAILQRYLHDYDGQAPRVPRFLVNDVLRYWRTVAVDYQAKRWKELDPDKWGERYLKLRSTRKLTFAGSLIGVLLPAITGRDTTAAALLTEMDKPPLARLASLAPLVTAVPAARQSLGLVLTIADEFLGMLADPDWRQAVRDVQDPSHATPGSTFARARQRTLDLQEALDGLFHSEMPVVGAGEHISTIRDLTRHYLMF